MTVSEHLAGGLDRVDQVGHVVGRGQARLGGGGGPGRLEVGVDHLGGGDDGDPLPVDGDPERGEGLGGVLADAQDGVPRLLSGGQGHLQAGRPAILAVVVGLRHQGHPGPPEGLDGTRRRREHVLLGLGIGTGAAVGQGRLEVGHGEIDPRQQLLGPRSEGGGRVVGQPGGQDASGWEIVVAGEGEGDRFPVAIPIRVERGPGGQRRMMDGTVGRRSMRRPGDPVTRGGQPPAHQGQQRQQAQRPQPPVPTDPSGDGHRPRGLARRRPGAQGWGQWKRAPPQPFVPSRRPRCRSCLRVGHECAGRHGGSIDPHPAQVGTHQGVAVSLRAWSCR